MRQARKRDQAYQKARDDHQMVDVRLISTPTVDLVSRMIAFIDQRLDCLLMVPRMWGSLESVELQVLMLLEFRAITLGISITDFMSSYFKFIKEKITDALPTTLASQVAGDDKKAIGLLAEFVERRRGCIQLAETFAEELNRQADPSKQRVVDQPPPTQRPGAEPVWDLVVADMQRRYSVTSCVYRLTAARVIEDMRERDRVGRERYGTPLTAHNGRDQLVDAYQEILDASVYARAAMAEGTLVPEAVYDNLLDNLVTVRRLIDRRAELAGGAE